MTDILALSDEGGSEASEHSFQLEMSAEEVDGAEAENANAVDGASAGGSGPASNSHVSMLFSASAIARIRLEEEEQRLRIIEASRRMNELEAELRLLYSNMGPGLTPQSVAGLGPNRLAEAMSRPASYHSAQDRPSFLPGNSNGATPVAAIPIAASAPPVPRVLPTGVARSGLSSAALDRALKPRDSVLEYGTSLHSAVLEEMARRDGIRLKSARNAAAAAAGVPKAKAGNVAKAVAHPPAAKAAAAPSASAAAAPSPKAAAASSVKATKKVLVCYNMVNFGVCERKGCSFSHDPQLILEMKKKKKVTFGTAAAASGSSSAAAASGVGSSSSPFPRQ
jgi:hypothetical protein